MKTQIDFVDNATTKEAGIYAMKYGWAFTKGACRDINNFAHKLPWLCMGAVVIIAIAVSCVHIAEARIERDRSLKKQSELQTQIEQLSCALEAERGRK